MKITFVLPGIGKKKGDGYIKTWKMEPLTIATLKALTPGDVETEFYDDRLELINYDTSTDLVAITAETYTAARAYIIAGEFRKRGIKVVIGGYHASLMPQEVLEHADSVITGNAEAVWNKVISDFKNGILQKTYKGCPQFLSYLPDRSIYAGKKYLPLTLVETGRGCPFNCEFCSISSFYKSHYTERQVDDIVKEIEGSKNRYFFLVDDNIVAQPEYAQSLFTAITPLKIKWTSQGTLTMGRDPKLLKLMKKSGCDTILIGFESLDEKNLNQMKKDWSFKLGERDELINRIHDEGISIYATFVFGFDNDNEASFDRALEFSQKHNFFFTAFNHLLPFPGTQLYLRLKEEGRLTSDKWWLEPGYHYGDIPYMPKNMTPERLSELCATARREFFKYPSIIKRGIKLFSRNKDPLLSLIFWTQNINLKHEVDGKLRIPVGSGLDEMPK
ncbi:MAG: B12-binding domain-containing radical SAM protein [Clostridiaceae bacterium]|nr:B12-binding domain-containing radical SAM protein [Clostridiaceae bacterium]